MGLIYFLNQSILKVSNCSVLKVVQDDEYIPDNRGISVFKNGDDGIVDILPGSPFRPEGSLPCLNFDQLAPPPFLQMMIRISNSFKMPPC